jgi:predicted nuclease with TOPRIM domain
MADIKPEPKALLRLRVEQKMAECKYNLSRFEVRKAELKFEEEKLLDNVAALQKALDEYANELSQLQ